MSAKKKVISTKNGRISIERSKSGKIEVRAYYLMNGVRSSLLNDSCGRIAKFFNLELVNFSGIWA